MVQLLNTKLFIPSTRPEKVSRPHLIKRLNEGLHRKLTLVSAPAGFGKTTLVSEWAATLTPSPLPVGEGDPMGQLGVAWLSLDEDDKDPSRFLTYLVGALQTVAGNIGAGALTILQVPQHPSTESILTMLLNEINTVPQDFILVLDDYHVVDSKPVDRAITFLLEHLPPQMHLVITTREDPDLPLARLRAQDQLTELRAADLRFTRSEATEFLKQVMHLPLSAEDMAALENRTEGWIAGLQLAALALLAMQGKKDITGFIQSFTGSHHFIMDYLMEEVLKQQSESLQTFLLRTSILDRMCGPLCDAVLLDPSIPGQATLEHLERANLFIIPLDNERRWYRYHHLFADLLQQRLPQSLALSSDNTESLINELHIRASQWYEANGFDLEAFQHAAAAHDIERAERLIEGDGIPRHLRGAVTTILDWLASLPKAVMDARPALWWRYASLLLVNGQTTGVAEKLEAAEAGSQGMEANNEARNLVGRIAAARATLALTRYDAETMIVQSQRALDYLDANNLSARANAHWTLGFAYLFQGNRSAAHRSLMEAVSLSQATGAIFTTILATLGLGNLQEADNQLHQAAETYRHILQITGDQPLQIIGEVHLGLARVLYEWNDLEGAEEHGQKSLQLVQQYESVIDRFIISEVFLARLKLARGDVTEAAAILAKANQSARQQNFVYRIPEVATAQVLTLLRQGNLETAEQLAQEYNLPVSQARVYLAQGNPPAALIVLEAWRQRVEAKDWKDERLRVIILQALAHQQQSEKDKAVALISEALELAEPGGFIRLLVDEGPAMAQLLSEAARRSISSDYVIKLLAVFEAEAQKLGDESSPSLRQPLIEPLSPRELEVLRLIAQGLSNDEIGKRLFLALDTVKGHNRRIYDKLQVQRRTEAIARARELGLL